MPWFPELFSESTRLRLLAERHQLHELDTVPYFAGILTGETDALIGSFAGEPEVHYPVRGRVKGPAAFIAYTAATKAWLDEREASIEEVGLLRTDRRTVGEAVLHLAGPPGELDLPVAIVADRRPDRRLEEVRVYYSNGRLDGQHVNRPPLLQPHRELRQPDAVSRFQRALVAGDLDAVLASFESSGYVRGPSGEDSRREDPEDLAELYRRSFSNGGGLNLEHCSCAVDGNRCAVEYNLVRWGRTELAPQAGIAVFELGDAGKLAAARFYDDVDPPLAEAA